MKYLSRLISFVVQAVVTVVAAVTFPFAMAKTEVESGKVGLGVAVSLFRVLAWVGLVAVSFVFVSAPAFLVAVITAAAYIDFTILVISVLTIGGCLAYAKAHSTSFADLMAKSEEKFA